VKKETVLVASLLLLVFASIDLPILAIKPVKEPVRARYDVDISVAGTITNATFVYPVVQVYDGQMRLEGNPAGIDYTLHVVYKTGTVDVSALVALLRTSTDGRWSCPFSRIISLSPGEDYTETVTWYEDGVSTETGGKGIIEEDNWTISLYASPVASGGNDVEDTNTANNKADSPYKVETITWPVDLDGSGEVDIIDIFIAAKTFSSEEGDPRWNPVADINKDGKVNILDLVSIGKWYSWPFIHKYTNVPIPKFLLRISRPPIDVAGTTNPPVGDHGYIIDSKVTVTATPGAPNLALLSYWNLDGVQVGKEDAYKTGKIVITMNKDHALQAVFKEKKKITFKVGPEWEEGGGGGKVYLTGPPSEVRPGYVASPGSYFDFVYPEGYTVQIKAVPDPGFKFKEWLVENKDTGTTWKIVGETASVAIASNLEVVAVFEKETK
jgi:hypothetical protein